MSIVSFLFILSSNKNRAEKAIAQLKQKDIRAEKALASLKQYNNAKYYLLGATANQYNILLTHYLNITKRDRLKCSSILNKNTAILIVSGQSNAANFGEDSYIPQNKVYEYNHGFCFLAQDPLVGANGGFGSVWIRLADKLIEKGIYENVIISAAAVGGSSVKSWAMGGQNFPLLFKSLADLKSKGIKPTHFLWHQGETDGAKGTSKEDYKAYFGNMYNSLKKNGFKGSAFIAIASRCNSLPFKEIQDAQKELAKENKDIELGPNTDLIYGKLDRYDNCHFSATGLEKHANAWLDVLIKFNLRNFSK